MKGRCERLHPYRILCSTTKEIVPKEIGRCKAGIPTNAVIGECTFQAVAVVLLWSDAERFKSAVQGVVRIGQCDLMPDWTLPGSTKFPIGLLKPRSDRVFDDIIPLLPERAPKRSPAGCPLSPHLTPCLVRHL